MYKKSLGQFNIPDPDKATANEYSAAYQELLDLEEKIDSFIKVFDKTSLGKLRTPNFTNPLGGELEVLYDDIQNLEVELNKELDEGYSEFNLISRNYSHGGAHQAHESDFLNMIPVVGGIISSAIQLFASENKDSPAANKRSMEDSAKILENIRKELERPDLTSEDKDALRITMFKEAPIYKLAIVTVAAGIVKSSIKARKS